MFTSSFVLTHTPPHDIYTLSLHDALPICAVVLLRAADVIRHVRGGEDVVELRGREVLVRPALAGVDRHVGSARSEEHTSELQSPCISYAVFCLKKKR